MSHLLEHDASAECDGATWSLHVRSVEIDGAPRPLRLVRFAAGWLASVDTEGGPTLGADSSPYLAARRALEPLGVGMVEAMTAVGPIPG